MRAKHVKGDTSRQLFLVALLLVLLSPTLFSLAPRAPWATPADFIDARYLCSNDPSATLADLGKSDAPPFKDPRCSLCTVLASAVCPSPAPTALIAEVVRFLPLLPATSAAPVLALLALPLGARAPPALI